MAINEELKKLMTGGVKRLNSISDDKRTSFQTAAQQMTQRQEAAVKRQESAKTTRQKSETYQTFTKAAKAKNAWQYRADGTRKTFSELTTPEVLTWIGTLPGNEQAEAARQFETDYLKNPGSTRYDPYYTQYSNNQEARDYFGVDTFDQEWIDANVGLRQYLTFSGEKYDSPKAPGKNATEQEKAAYLYWQIANTYEATTQAAETEYAKLRQEVQDTVKARQAAGEAVTADEILAGIDWDEYETIENLRTTAKAGNARMLNRPVQVGDASLRSMVLAAIRGEDVTADRDFLWDESQYIGRGGYGVQEAEADEESSGAAPEAAETAEEERNFFGRAADAVGGWFGGAEESAEDQKWWSADNIWKSLGLNADAVKKKYFGDRIDKPLDERISTAVEEAGNRQKDALDWRYSLNNPETEAKEANSYADKVTQYRDQYSLSRAAYFVQKDVDQLEYAVQSGLHKGETLTALKALLTEAQQELNKLQDEITQQDASAKAASAAAEAARQQWAEDQLAEKVKEIYGSMDTEEVSAPTYNAFVGKWREEYGLASSIGYVKTRMSELTDQGNADRQTMSADEKELLNEFEDQLYLLESEQDARSRIQERVREAAEPDGGGILKWLWNNNFSDAVHDGDKVPLDRYEEYLRYRLTSFEYQDATGAGAEIRPYSDLSEYDTISKATVFAGYAAAVVPQAIQGLAHAPTWVWENAAYQFKKTLPQYEGMTKEEMYAADVDLQDFRAYNSMFEKEITSPEFDAEHPTAAMISSMASELLKMNWQAGLAQNIGQWMGGTEIVGRLSKLNSSGQLTGTLQRMPFAVDAFAQGIETARQEGADDDQAFTAGLLNAIFVGPLSSMASGGLEKLGGAAARLFTSKSGRLAAEAGAQAAGKQGIGKAIWSIARSIGASALIEGAEEATEDALLNLFNKMVYDHDKPWTGEGGVLDTEQLATSGGAGAVLGAVYMLLAGYGGRMGRGAKAKADKIVQDVQEGADISLKEELEYLSRIVGREAAIQDAAAQIEEAHAGETEAAVKAAETKQAEAEKAAEEEKAAKARTAEAKAGVQPLIDALNDGTASYTDPETVRKISEGHKTVTGAKEAETAASARSQTAAEEARKAADEAEAERDRVRRAARDEAAAQVDEEIAREREEAAQAAQEAEATRAEAERRALTEETTPGVKMVSDAKLDADQKGQVNVLDALAKRYGLEIDIVDSLGGKNAKYGGGRRIVVALDALDQAYVQAGAHEMVHYIRETDDAEYRALEAIVLEELQKDEDFDLEREITERIEQYEGTQELSRDQALEEIIAEAVPTVFTNEESMRALVQRNASLAQRIRDWFVKFAKRLRDIALEYAADNGRAEIAALADRSDSLMEIAYALDDAMMSARARNEETSQSTEAGTEEVRYSTNISFEEQLRRLRAGGFPRNDHLYVMETPEVLQGVGLEKLPMLITQKHAKSVMKTSGPDKKANYHGLTITMMKQLPEAIANPAMIIKAKGYDSRIIVITELKDDKGSTVIAPIEMNGEGTWQDVRIDANILTTAYGKSNLKDTLTHAVMNDEVLYADKKRSDALGQSVGVQFPKSLTRNGSFIHSIADFQKNVNDEEKLSLNAETDKKGEHAAYGPNRPTEGDGTYTNFKTAAEAQANAEEMRLDVDTDEFREWFQDSKVVDEQGEPKIMYHGTSGSGFTQFDTYGSRYGLMGTGSYFTDNPDIAESYTKKGKGKKPGVYPVYLSIQKPVDMDAKITAEEAKAWSDYFGEYVLAGEIRAGMTHEEALRAVENGFHQEGMTKGEAGDYVVQFFESQGYDGITHTGGGRHAKSDGTRHRVYIAFEPTQVKSATGNFGDFDAENPDIRYSANTAYSYAELTAKPDMPVTAIDTSANITQTEAVRMAQENIEKHAMQQQADGAPMIYVDDLGKHVIVGKKGLTHGLDRRTDLQAPVITKIGDILKSSIVVNEADPKKEGVRNSYILLGAARAQDGDLVLVRSVVNQSSGHLEDVSALYAVYGKRKEAGQKPTSDGISRVNTARLGENAWAHPSDSTISIAELLKAVNGLFDDVVSRDVAKQLNIERSPSEFSERLRYSANPNGEARPDEDKIQEDAILASGEARREDTQKSINKLAGDTVREYKSAVQRAAVVDGLNEMIEQYAANEDAEAAEAIADRVAKEIVGSSSKTDVSHREGYEATRKRLWAKGVSLTDTQKQEVANWYGDYEAWRRSMMGNVKIKKGAPSLDSIWGELSDAHPEMFPADTHEAEMPEVLNRFVMQMKPKYMSAYGMDRTGVVADLSLKLQGEVLKIIGKPDQAETAIQAAEQLRATYAEENDKRLDEERTKRVEAYRKMADELLDARNRGDKAAYAAAIRKYQQARTDSIRLTQGANALAIGEQVRVVRKEQRRIGKIIAQLNDQIEAENVDASRERMIEERNMYKGMLDDLNQNGRYLHRLQAIAQAGMDPAADPETIEAEAALEQLLMQDMAEELEDHGAAEVRERIQEFSEAMKAKQKDYNITSVLMQKDVAEFFGDLEGEMVMQSDTQQIWRQRYETAEAAMNADDAELKALREQLRQAERLGIQSDITDIKARIADCQDRIAVSESQMKRAKAQEAYAKRCGALSIGQAMRQGKLPQPVMERIVSMCIDAGRRGRFNTNALVQTMDKSRLTWTMLNRTFDDYFGAASPIMRGVYIDPYMDNETAKVRWENEWTKRIKGLNLSQKESEIVQKVGERRNTLNELTEGMSAGQVARIQEAINVFREFYDDAYERAGGVLKRNGFEMGHIRGYFPHMDLTQSWLEKIGVRVREYSVPTSINGLTENFTPKHKYSGHLEHRKGIITDYDAVAGFNEYMKSMGDVIFHTDDIQRIRQFETEIRAAAKSGVFGPGIDGHESTHMSEFVKHLHEIGNIWAGKKSSADRGKEDEQGRPAYAILDWMKRIRGASAVMGNLSSAITNTAPITIAFSEHPFDMIKACGQMLRGVGNGRSEVPESQFKIRRFGHDDPASGVHDYLKRMVSKGEVQTTFTGKAKQGLENAAGSLFDLIDLFATNVVVNTYYNRNRRIGMNPETAMRRADDQAARRMGERNKGYMPTIYASKSRGFVTQFQFEPANLSQWLRKDLMREHGGLRAGAVTLTMSLTGFLLNELLERLTGKRPNIDPIHIGWDMYNTWKEEGEILPVIQTGLNEASELFPYVGNARTPAALDKPLELFEAIMEKGSTPEKIGYAFGEAAMAFIPGSNQIKKSAQGYQAVKAGGHYSASGKKLYYPLDKTPATWAQALAFGKSATHEAQAYYAGEADALTEAQTRAYRANVERGMSPTEAYRNAISVRDAERLMDSAKEAENAEKDAEARLNAGMEPKESDAADVSEAPGMREEAGKTREGAIPNELTDAWYERRDEPAVSNAIELWRKTGDKWALPIEYTEENKWTIDKETQYLGPALVPEANAMYEQGFKRIMSGVNVGTLSEKQVEELIEELKDLKDEVDKKMKKRIQETRG